MQIITTNPIPLVCNPVFALQTSGLYEYKVYGTLDDCPPDVCSEVYLDLEYRKKWDSYVSGNHSASIDISKIYDRLRFVVSLCLLFSPINKPPKFYTFKCIEIILINLIKLLQDEQFYSLDKLIRNLNKYMYYVYYYSCTGI